MVWKTTQNKQNETIL